MKLHKFSKNTKNRIWSGSIIAAFIAAAAVFFVMLQTEKKVLTEYEKTVVCVAAEDIPKGENITKDNLYDYVIRQEIDSRIVPDTAVRDPEEIIDRITVHCIDKGSVVTGGMLESRQQIIEEMDEPVIAGFRAEDLYQAVGGVLRAGDRIHIYCIDKGEDPVAGRPAWKNLFVQQVFDQNGNVIGSDDTVTPAQRINVYMDNANVDDFYSNLANGSIRVVKICN